MASNNMGETLATHNFLRKEINTYVLRALLVSNCTVNDWLILYCRSPSQHAKMASPMNIKNAFGNFIPAKVEVKLAHNIGNSNMNNMKNGQPNMMRRSTSASIDVVEKNGGAGNGSSNTAAQSMPMSYKLDKKKIAQNRRFEKNIAFGTPSDDPVMDKDFDFEGNLALFDKQAIWNKIDANQKPDVVRQTGHVNKKNYRHDENILISKPLGYRQIKTKHASAQEYVTDDGIIIPSISLALRARIQMQAEVFGLEWDRLCDMLSRSTVELALQMLGGARRLSPKNQHQWPKICIICDEMCNERHSDLGFSTGRQLASQGLQVHILVKPNLNYALQSNREAELFKATGNAITMTIDELPSCDLIILAVPKPITDLNVIKWIGESR